MDAFARLNIDGPAIFEEEEQQQQQTITGSPVQSQTREDFVATRHVQSTPGAIVINDNNAGYNHPAAPEPEAAVSSQAPGPVDDDGSNQNQSPFTFVGPKPKVIWRGNYGSPQEYTYDEFHKSGVQCDLFGHMDADGNILLDDSTYESSLEHYFGLPRCNYIWGHSSRQTPENIVLALEENAALKSLFESTEPHSAEVAAIIAEGEQARRNREEKDARNAAARARINERIEEFNRFDPIPAGPSGSNPSPNHLPMRASPLFYDDTDTSINTEDEKYDVDDEGKAKPIPLSSHRSPARPRFAEESCNPTVRYVNLAATARRGQANSTHTSVNVRRMTLEERKAELRAKRAERKAEKAARKAEKVAKKAAQKAETAAQKAARLASKGPARKVGRPPKKDGKKQDKKDDKQ